MAKNMLACFTYLWNEHVESVFIYYTSNSPSVDLKFYRCYTNEMLYSPLVTCICIHWSQEVFPPLACLCYFTHHFGFVLALPMSVPAVYVENWVMSVASVCILVRCYSAPSSALAFSLSWCHFGFFFAPLVWLLWLPKLLLPAHWFACSLSLTVRLIRHKLP